MAGDEGCHQHDNWPFLEQKLSISFGGEDQKKVLLMMDGETTGDGFVDKSILD
jgi:hypothetical protein